MHVDNSPIPEGEIEEFEDAWEEIEYYGKTKSNYTNEKSYILIENRESDDFLAEMGITGWYEFPRIMMTPIEEGKWGVVINHSKEKQVSTDELKTIVKDFFEGKISN